MQQDLRTRIQVWRRHPAFPAQWLYGLYEFALVTGFLATIIPEKRFASRCLDASTGASGPHDFTVRNDGVRLSPPRVHRSPSPTSVTIAIRPSCGPGCGSCK